MELSQCFITTEELTVQFNKVQHVLESLNTFQLKKGKYKADFVQTNIYFNVYPKDIYLPSNHYTKRQRHLENLKRDSESSELHQWMTRNLSYTMNLNTSVQIKGENHFKGILREQMKCDAFDSDVDEGPITQTMFMTNLTSEDRIYDEAGTSYDSNTLLRTCKTRIQPNSITEGKEIFEQTKRCYLTEVIPFFKTLKEHFVGVQTALFKEVKEMEEIFDQMNNEVDKNTIDKQCAEIEKKNLLIEKPLLGCDRLGEWVNGLVEEIESLKAQLRSKESCFTSDYVKPKVLAPGMYAIDVKPIPHPLKNNRSAHLNYISHLKESVETVREIVEEARVVKPLDNALNYACQYTKLSQELLEYVIGTCPKSFNERDNKAPSTPVTRKKQVTFSDKPGTSSSNTQKHEVHQKVQQTNVHVIHSTGVNTSTEASGSKPRSNTKKNRILPAKSENKKKVEDHPRTNKSVWTKVNRVDSGISSKRVVINSNSESMCKTCNKCLNSASHGMCVVNILNSVNVTPTVRIVLNKEKQIWKPKGKMSDNRQVWKPKGKLSDNSLHKTKQIWQPKGKLFDNSLKKTKQVWKATGKLFANVGYQWRPTGKKFTSGKLNCGYQWRPTGKKFALGELCPLTRLPVTCGTDHPLVSGLRLFKTRFRGINGSCLAPQCIKMFEHSSSSLGLHCQKTFKQISSNLVSQMSQRRLLASLQAPFLKEKKGVRFSALYLQQKRNLLVLDHSHQQVSVVKWINVDQRVGLNKTVRYTCTDNGTEFVNQVMSEYYEGVGIFHQKSIPRTPQQNGVVERRNRTLVEAALTPKTDPLIHTRHNKTPYELVHDKKPDLTFLRVFGALCYPTNDSEDLGKFQAKADIGIFVGYAPSRKGYRIYNKRTRRLMEIIHVTFDEMHQSMAPVRMINAQVVPPGTSLSTTIAQDAPSTSASSSTSDMHHPDRHQGIAEEPTLEDSPTLTIPTSFILPMYSG
ncbi:retrovirus-related pol polyprotein from transposon TNT 1-94 [Tanacetum coccineum]|uniref:Retrovirus-related pol polyprotein from transposon TNT 1-94 n=1 Tax=Tanacetum coccineum TaxID=301880 RepID=A0ABQ4WNR6_9ASTR